MKISKIGLLLLIAPSLASAQVHTDTSLADCDTLTVTFADGRVVDFQAPPHCSAPPPPPPPPAGGIDPATLAETTLFYSYESQFVLGTVEPGEQCAQQDPDGMPPLDDPAGTCPHATTAVVDGQVVPARGILWCYNSGGDQLNRCRQPQQDQQWALGRNADDPRPACRAPVGQPGSPPILEACRPFVNAEHNSWNLLAAPGSDFSLIVAFRAYSEGTNLPCPNDNTTLTDGELRVELLPGTVRAKFESGVSNDCVDTPIPVYSVPSESSPLWVIYALRNDPDGFSSTRINNGQWQPYGDGWTFLSGQSARLGSTFTAANVGVAFYWVANDALPETTVDQVITYMQDRL